MTEKKLFNIPMLIGLATTIFGAWLQSNKASIFFINDVVVISVGCSIIAASVYDMVTYETKEKTSEFYYSIHDEFGIDKIFKNRTLPEDDCNQIIASSKGQLCALGHTMGRFIQQNKKQIINAAIRGVEVKVLALADKKILDNKELFKEESSFLRQREAEEMQSGNDAPEKCSSGLIQTIREMNTEIVKSGKGKQIELRFYTAFPVNSSMFNEKSMVAGGFFHKKESGSSYTLKLSKGVIFDQYKENFDELWKDTRFTYCCDETKVTKE